MTEMKQTTSILTQKYWLDILRGWLEQRVEHDLIAPPQGAEAIAAVDDLMALLNLPGMPRLVELAEHVSPDFTVLMEHIEERLNSTYDANDKPWLTDDRLNEITALIAVYSAERIDKALQAARANWHELEREARESGAQHVYTHTARDEAPLINTKVERNSRGYTWSATIEGARSVEEAETLGRDVMASLERVYGPQNIELAKAAAAAAAKKKSGKGARGNEAAEAEGDEGSEL